MHCSQAGSKFACLDRPLNQDDQRRWKEAGKGAGAVGRRDDEAMKKFVHGAARSEQAASYLCYCVAQQSTGRKHLLEHNVYTRLTRPTASDERRKTKSVSPLIGGGGGGGWKHNRRMES